MRPFHQRVGFLGSGPETLRCANASRVFMIDCADWDGRMGGMSALNTAGSRAVGKPARIRRDLVRSNPDLLVAAGTPAAQALQRTSRSILIVFSMVSDPVASGLVVSIARPLENINGVSNFFPATTGNFRNCSRPRFPGRPAWSFCTIRAAPGSSSTCGNAIGLACTGLEHRTGGVAHVRRRRARILCHERDASTCAHHLERRGDPETPAAVRGARCPQQAARDLPGSGIWSTDLA